MNADDTLPADMIAVEEDMDVYAVYSEHKHVVMDANGGYFPARDDVPEINYYYLSGEVFEPYYEPVIDDENRKFAGWATTPDAKEPDVAEGYVLAEDLGDRIYAVYSETVKVTYIGNGGYFMGNPERTTYETTIGKGHIFTGMRVFTDDTRMEHVGWKDQNGTVILEADEYPDYFITGDSVFTAAWGRRIVVDANGGYFFEEEDEEEEITALRLLFYLDDPFSSSYINMIIGLPQNHDESKYLAGWATTRDAQEPDLIEGKSSLDGLNRIYAVWAGGSGSDLLGSSPEKPDEKIHIPVEKVMEGWVQDGYGRRFYEKNMMVTDKWLSDKGSWYYLGVDGFAQKGWLLKNDNWYYLDPDTGIMQTGWISYNDGWYYLDPDTGIMQTGWILYSGSWYYLDPDSGAMRTGWLLYNGSWYYLYDLSGQMCTGWLYDENAGTWYYLQENGIMAAGEYMIGDTWYVFGADGAWIQ